MRFPKAFLCLCLIGVLVGCGEETTDIAPETKETATNNVSASRRESDAENTTYCYAITTENTSIWATLDLDADGIVQGELTLSNYSREANYSTSAIQSFDGFLDDNTLEVRVDTAIEGDRQITDEVWYFSADELSTDQGILYSIDCDAYRDANAYLEENPPTDLADEILLGEENAYTEEILSSEVIECDASESVFLVAETENFWLNICGGDLPYTYIGIDKATGDRLRLDLSYYEEDGSYFEAINGNYTYSIIFGSAKGSFLSVSQGDKQIVQEPLLSW